MSIIETLKDIIGYSGSDLDSLFVIVALIILIFFIFSLFNILNSIFKKGRY